MGRSSNQIDNAIKTINTGVSSASDGSTQLVDGVQTFKTIKATEGFNIPVVALTANAIVGSREKYLADGFNDYLAKPINKDQLKTTNQNLLDFSPS